MYKYTKINDELVAKFNLKTAWVYAKLHYRMNLSNKHHKYYDSSRHSHYIIYKVNDLAKDCHMSRSSVINALKKLEKAGLIAKDRTMFCNHIYLPKYETDTGRIKKVHHESAKSRLSLKPRDKNKDSKNCVYSSTVHTVKHSKNYPKFPKLIKTYGKSLVKYAIERLHIESNKRVFLKIHNPYLYIIGILRRWRRKGIKNIRDAMWSEHDLNYLNYDKGPEIPIFKI